MATASETATAKTWRWRELLVRRIDAEVDPERAFVHLYGRSRNAFWLDSGTRGERGRFSFMGDDGGPRAALVTYDVDEGRVRIARGERVALHDESIFDFLDATLPEPSGGDPRLPFELACGFVGYLGYELRADCDASATHRASTPDAAFVFADRLIAFDHREGHVYLLALTTLPPELHRLFHPADGEVDAAREGGDWDAARGAEEWIAETGDRLRDLSSLDEPEPQGPVELRLRRPEPRYLEDIAACKDYLRAGDSYEICLTNGLGGESRLDPLELYRSLRRANPAPFAAYLRFGDTAVLSSSPERFLAVDRMGRAETRPIKGTIRRGSNAAEDAELARALRDDTKSRAEHVTIVDLMRNDLGRVCEIGSVEVTELAWLETYATVHQLVSGVRGRLADGAGAAACVRACFPPGSMTGAPKLRTMEIIDELEGAARGVYSGAIGFFGLDGACDLSVAIRTIVCEGNSLALGAGGAIVADSDPEAELEEMLLKANAAAAAFSESESAHPVAALATGQFSFSNRR